LKIFLLYNQLLLIDFIEDLAPNILTDKIILDVF